MFFNKILLDRKIMKFYVLIGIKINLTMLAQCTREIV